MIWFSFYWSTFYPISKPFYYDILTVFRETFIPKNFWEEAGSGAGTNGSAYGFSTDDHRGLCVSAGNSKYQIRRPGLIKNGVPEFGTYNELRIHNSGRASAEWEAERAALASESERVRLSRVSPVKTCLCPMRPILRPWPCRKPKTSSRRRKSSVTGRAKRCQSKF